MERDARPTKRTPVQQAGAAKFSSIKRIQAKQVIQQAAASVGWPGTGIG